MKHWGQGYDATGCGADIALEYLYKHNPPYIFGSPESVSVGDTFKIKDYPFQVVRMCTEAEYLAAMGGSSQYARQCVCYFEAVTD